MPSVRQKPSHSQSLKKKCFFCPRKAPKYQLSETHKKFISENVFPPYKNYGHLFPSGECGNCNVIVSDKIKNGNESKRKLPNQDYDEILKLLLARQERLRKQTRRSPCHCFICNAVKKDCIIPKKSRGVSKKQKEKEKKCKICFSIISPGKHKNCSRNEGVNNLMQDVSPKTRLRLCLATIREEQAKKNSSSPIMVSSSLGGPSVPLSIKSSDSSTNSM